MPKHNNFLEEFAQVQDHKSYKIATGFTKRRELDNMIRMSNWEKFLQQLPYL